MDKIAIWDFTR